MTTASPQQPGQGRIHCSAYGDKAIFQSLSAKYPLKFLSPQAHRDRVAIAYMLTYGGGMLSDDNIVVDIDVDSNAALVLLTQGFTKVYKSKKQHRSSTAAAGQGAHQTLTARIAPTATLLLLPDPVACFRASSYIQRQTFHLASLETSTLVVLDWFTSGRLSHGESWAFRRYATRNDVYVDGRLVIRDSTLLEDENSKSVTDDTSDASPEEDTATSYAARLGPYTCFATLIVLGAGLASAVTGILARFDEITLRQVTKPREMMWTASPVCGGVGVLVRVAGMETEAVRRFLKEECLRNGVGGLMGDMFERAI